MCLSGPRCLLRLQLDLDLNTGGELDAHEGVHSLLGRLHDIDQTLVSSGLELLTAVLVDVDRTQDGDDLTLGGQRDGTRNLGTICLSVNSSSETP